MKSRVSRQSSHTFAVSPLMFCSIRRIAEELLASRMKTGVRSFAGVWARMNFQVLQPRKRLVAAVKLQTQKTTI